MQERESPADPSVLEPLSAASPVTYRYPPADPMPSQPIPFVNFVENRPPVSSVVTVPALPGAPTAETQLPESSSGMGRWWLWLVSGMVIASLVWLTALEVTGGFNAGTGKPDVRGYRHVNNLCEFVDLTAVTAMGSTVTDADQVHKGLDNGVRDSMSCEQTLQAMPGVSSDRGASAGIPFAGRNLLLSDLTIFRRTDPGPDFTADHGSMGGPRAGGGQSRKVAGLADEAYVTTNGYPVGGEVDVTVSVRDGWVIYYTTWFGVAPDAVDQATDALQKSAAATLMRLRKH